MENYVTLFDHRFLPMGLALHTSLIRHSDPCTLWVVCLDEVVEQQLLRLNRRNLVVIPLRELEGDELRQARTNRSWREYCWTLSSSAMLYVLERLIEPNRVTYLDADLCFFASPRSFFKEFDESGKQVMITEHAFDPRYSRYAATSGRFCVQFVTANRSLAAIELLRDWAAKCIADCSMDIANGVVGDQKYLDDWPVQFGDRVHVLEQREQTLAPWNADFYQAKSRAVYLPVLFHFHGFRIVSERYARIRGSYRCRNADHIYKAYLNAIKFEVQEMAQYGIELPTIPLSTERFWIVKNIRRLLFERMVIRRHFLVAS